MWIPLYSHPHADDGSSGPAPAETVFRPPFMHVPFFSTVVNLFPAAALDSAKTPEAPGWAAAVVIAAVLALLPRTGHAQTYPAKPVRIVVPATAGGATDIQARAVAQIVGDALKQSFIVDDRGGGGGVVAATLVAKAPPDGYTLLMATPFVTVLPAVLETPAYDPIADFAPVALLFTAPYLLVTHPGGRVASVKDLVTASKEGNPLNIGVTVGSGPHLAAAQFAAAARLKMVFIPYKGLAPALTDVIAGQIDLAFGSMLGSLQYVKSGRLRALAVSSAARSPVLPDLPTLAESLVPGYEAGSWFGWMAPAHTPEAIIRTLQTELIKATANPALQKIMAQDGAVAVGQGAAAFRKLIAEEVPRWRKIAHDAGVKLQ